MASAKDIVLKPIERSAADATIQRLHYSGKTVNNSQLHIGVFLRDRLEGAMQFGPSLDKRKIQGLVRGTGWNDFLELNRMAFSERLPRNSESRAISVAMRMLRKHAPHVGWVISFADATQCGDGTIYRASGFVLTDIKPSKNLVRTPTGEVVHKMSLMTTGYAPRPELRGRSFFDVTNGGQSLSKYLRASGSTVIPGYQLRYLYFLDPACRDRLTVPEVPFSRITEIGATMYRGKRAGD